MKRLIEDILKQNGITFEDLKQKKAIKVEVKGYMPLNIDYLGQEQGMDKWAVAHNCVQNGDIMADPDMEFYDCGLDEWYPRSYQQDHLGIYQEAIWYKNGIQFKNLALERQLRRFARHWAGELRNQGFVHGKIS